MKCELSFRVEELDIADDEIRWRRKEMGEVSKREG
jgi:hypothetical protein